MKTRRQRPCSTITFICIKVDREERPDIDNIYMAVCQVLTRSGGWPLTILLEPDKTPFYAATYIPKEGRYGRKGLIEIVPQVRELGTADAKKCSPPAAST